MNFPKYKAISFDFSGTLAVSEVIERALIRHGMFAIPEVIGDAKKELACHLLDGFGQAIEKKKTKKLTKEINECYGKGDPRTLKEENSWLNESIVKIINLLKIKYSPYTINKIKGYISPEKIKFKTYPDTIYTLRALKRKGIKICVTSNSWPSLNRILISLGLKKYLDTVVISSKVGYEKPSKEIFEISSRRLGVDPGEMMHVGNEESDIVGARAAGMIPVLIDRKGKGNMDCITIGSLREILNLL